MMEKCEVRDEYPSDSSPVMMEDFVNKNLDETHRYISDHDIETNWCAMKMVIEELPDGHHDDKIKKYQRKNTKVYYTELLLRIKKTPIWIP